MKYKRDDGPGEGKRKWTLLFSTRHISRPVVWKE